MNQRFLSLVLLVGACGSVDDDPDPAVLETLPDAAPPVADAGTTMSSPEAPSVSGLNVRDVLTARAAHQGAAGVPVHIHGERLSAATVAIDGVPLVTTSFSDTELVVTWDIAHGAPLGGRTVVVSSPSGTTTVTDGVEVTAIHIDAGLREGDGTPATPYGNLAAALALAGPGDEVRLHGSFRLTETMTVPGGVHVIGEKTTVLEPGLRDEPQIGVTLGTNSSLAGVTLRDFPSVCVATATEAKVSINEITTDGCPTGLLVTKQASATVGKATMGRHESAAISVKGGKAFHGTALAVTRSASGAGIVVDSGTILVEDSTLSHGTTPTPGAITPLVWDLRPALTTPSIELENVVFGVKIGTYMGPYLMNQNLRIEKPDNSVVVK
jgi:hypothetical protein